MRHSAGLGRVNVRARTDGWKKTGWNAERRFCPYEYGWSIGNRGGLDAIPLQVRRLSFMGGIRI